MTLDSQLPARQKLSTKITGALVGFLLMALVAIGVTLLLSWQLEGSSAAINETGSLRMHSYRLTLLLTRAVNTPEQPGLRAAAQAEMQSIDATFNLLKHSDPRRPLALPPADNIRDAFLVLSRHWEQGMRPLAVSSLKEGKESAAWRKFQSDAERFVFDIDRLVHAIERDSEWRTFWLRSSQLALVAMALAGTVALIYLMYMLIVDPVTRLSEGMKSMAAQDLSVRLPVESRDEFGQLTIGFNQMADRLQALYDSLEERVRRKTAALADQNRELALLYDIAAFLQLPQALEPMCKGFLRRLQTYFGADGGTVRVLDVHHGNLHMVVHHGISASLADSEHCLKVGECLCGAAVEKKIAVVHDLRKMDSANHLQCHREGFATVSVFHIYAHSQHLGFFNLHFRGAKAFSEREQALLETLGQLLGIAIENLRLAMREKEMAVSEERNLVAQGLHDSIAQGLTFLNIQVQMLEDSLRYGRVDEATSLVPVLRAGVQESYEDVRELLLNFRSRLAEDDLIGALKGTLDKFKRQTGIDAELIAKGNGAPFPREQQLQVLFIVQEALSNIRKHALASKVEVHVDDSQDFSLSIADNGVGFDSEKLAHQSDSHVGLNIMQERAHRIHATLDVASDAGKGTTVSLQLLREHRRAA